MGPQPSTTSTLRKVRTFADDVRRAQAGTSSDANTLTTATSVVAPTILARSLPSPTDTVSVQPILPKKTGSSFFSAAADTLMDINTLEDGHAEATIVSERKATRWSFSDAVVHSIQRWWQETVSDIKSDIASSMPKQLPVRTVPERGARIVRAAPPQSPTPAAVPESMPKTPDTTPRWTHTVTETEDALSKIARPTIRPEKPAPLPLPVPKATAAAIPVVPMRQYSSAPLPTERPSPKVADTDTLPTPPIDVTLAAREAAIKEESARFTARAREAALQRRAYEAAQAPTSSKASTYFVYTTLGMIALSLIIIVGSAGYALFYRQSTVIEAPKPGLSMLFAVSSSVAVPLTSERTSFMVELTKRISETRGDLGSFVRYYFFYQNDAAETELPIQALLDAFDLRAPGSMLRTIVDSSMFGVYIEARNAPFLVLKVRNFEDALGGMLLFEKNMNSDLAPVFGENLERIGTQGTFRDEVIGNIDARSLYDTNGNMVMTYAFIDRETIVITTSYTALGALAQVLK